MTTAILACPKLECPEKVLVRCFLPQELLSVNKFLPGSHWSSNNKHWKQTRDLWVPLLRSSEGLGVPMEHGDRKRKVILERWLGKGQRYWDEMNFAGGSAKCVVDALVRLGWLKDDTRQWIDLVMRERKPNELTETELEWWDQRKIRTVIEVHEIDHG